MSNIEKKDIHSSVSASEIISESETNLFSCYQCNKCTAGCPVAYEMDYTPAQIIQAIRLEQLDMVLSSKTIWLCSSCETCSTRCPQGVDIAAIMDACRIMATRKGIKARVPAISSCFELMLNNMRFFGRIYEVGLIFALKLKTGEYTKDIDLGRKMFLKGKLKLLPEKPTTYRKVRKIFDKIREIERTTK
jgi:heterodisulfide reductase subunit C